MQKDIKLIHKNQQYLSVQTLAVKKYNERDDIFIYNNKKKVKYLEVKEMSNAQNLHVKDFKKLLKVTQVVLSKQKDIFVLYKKTQHRKNVTSSKVNV